MPNSQPTQAYTNALDTLGRYWDYLDTEDTGSLRTRALIANAEATLAVADELRALRDALCDGPRNVINRLRP